MKPEDEVAGTTKADRRARKKQRRKHRVHGKGLASWYAGVVHKGLETGPKGGPGTPGKKGGG